MKKIYLCYFDHNNALYTPLDLAYVKALGLQKGSPVALEILKIKANREVKTFLKEAYYLASFEADDFVFFLDNVLWSMMYYWEVALFLIRKLKKLKPGVRIGLQSYKIKDAEVPKIFADHPEVDYLLRGEPEFAFLQYMKKNTYVGIPGFAYRKTDGNVEINPDPPLTNDLDQLPSPYVTEALGKYINERTSRSYFMSTSRGCPFRCHYCFRSVKFSKVRVFSVKRVLDEIEYLTNQGAQTIFMLDDCFIVSKPRFFDMSEAFQERFAGRNDLPNVHIMCRPEFLDESIIRRLPLMNIGFVQLGLQSIHPDTYPHMGRGVSIDRFKEIVTQLQSQNISVHLDVIIGLPNDDLEHCKKTIDLAFTLKPASLQIKQLYQNPHTLFDLHPEDYGILVESKKGLFSVPFVTETNTFSKDDMKKASQYADKLRQKHPKLIMKLITSFHSFNNFGK